MKEELDIDDLILLTCILTYREPRNRQRGEQVGNKNHRLSTKNGKVMVTHLIIESIIPGIFDPKKGHQIHHVDGNAKNNQNSNLVVCESIEYHKLLHAREKALKTCGNVHWRKCCRCKKYDSLDKLRHSKTQSQYWHTGCNSKNAIR
jgi:hypothetical protein